jgi:hypothetical protein
MMAVLFRFRPGGKSRARRDDAPGDFNRQGAESAKVGGDFCWLAWGGACVGSTAACARNACGVT